MRWGLSLLRGPGRAAALGVVAVALLVRAFDFAIVAEPRLRLFDLEERLWPGSNDAARVVIVDIDENSLARYGQWPWPRTLVAQLVSRIAEGHPRVLGIDIVFAEPDRLSPPEIARELTNLPASLAQQLAQLPSNDRDLTDAINKVPTVLALVTAREDTAPSAEPLRPAPIRQAGGDAVPFLKEYKSLLRSLPDLDAAAQGTGAIAAEPDYDGIVRRVALAVSYRGTVIPGFALEVLRVGGAERSIVIDTSRFGVTGIRMGGVAIPTDGRGRAIPHFEPPLARYISALDVLDPAFDPAKFRSKIVLLGVTGLGVADLQQTPLGLVQGVDVHAQLIESVLLDTLLLRPAYLFLIELAVALGAGLAAIWLLRYDRPVRAAAIALALVTGLIGLELALFGLADLLFDGTYPALTLLAAFGVMLVGTLRSTEAELGRERDAKQRYEGELATAQAIQMGLLPRRFPAFPDRPEIDVYARYRACANGRRRPLRLLADRRRTPTVLSDRRCFRQRRPGGTADGVDQGGRPRSRAQIRRSARPRLRGGQPENCNRQRRSRERGRRIRHRVRRDSRTRDRRRDLCQRRASIPVRARRPTGVCGN